MNNIETLSPEEFKTLPAVVEGESKEIRYLGNGDVAIRLKPTVYSYTHNRTGEIEGTDSLRLQASQILSEQLALNGIDHAYQYFSDSFIQAKLVLQPPTKDNPEPFRPDDIDKEELAKLPVAPPIEVVVKDRHVGTPKHRYYKFGNYPTREGLYIQPEDLYPNTVVRFDWRNPMHDEDGNRLADEVLGEEMADWFIDVKEARETARRAFSVLRSFMQSRGIDLWDICFFIAEDGKTMFGEISQDCGRYRLLESDNSLDKDVWRQGGSGEQVSAKWQQFVNLIS